MDRNALKRAMMEQFDKSAEEALDAVEKAPDGKWIAASEWQVREVFQKLMSQCYQQMLQARMDAAPQAAFSPCEPKPPQEQGKTSDQRADRRR